VTDSYFEGNRLENVKTKRKLEAGQVRGGIKTKREKSPSPSCKVVVSQKGRENASGVEGSLLLSSGGISSFRGKYCYYREGHKGKGRFQIPSNGGEVLRKEFLARRGEKKTRTKRTVIR